MRAKVAFLGVLALSLFLIGGDPDGVSWAVRPGGATYGATVIDQVDATTLRIDLGPPKGAEPRGIVVVRANRATRFALGGGMRGVTLLGSLGGARLGLGLPVVVTLALKLRDDGSYTLIELRTNTR